MGGLSLAAGAAAPSIKKALFPKTPKVTPPPLPEPAAIPEATVEAGETAIRRARRRKGFARTIITGSLEPATRKKTVLG